MSLWALGKQTLDFVDTITGGGFTIKNPNATSTCGCGSSFSTESSVITLDTEELNDHQARLLDVLCEEFKEAPLLDATSGPSLYHRLRTTYKSQMLQAIP